jgi:hypothetical protein
MRDKDGAMERHSEKEIRKQMKRSRKYHDGPPFKIQMAQPTTGRTETHPTLLPRNHNVKLLFSL